MNNLSRGPKQLTEPKNAIILLLIIFGLVYRLTAHHPNFSPMGAIALFSGFYFKKIRYALIPLFIMILSDVFLGFYELGIMLSVYLSYAVFAFLGVAVSKHKSMLYPLFGSLAGSIFFYVFTNLAVWLFGNWYPHTSQGLLQSYINALPFFRNSFTGDLIFTLILFGSYAYVRRYLPYKKLAINNNSTIHEK